MRSLSSRRSGRNSGFTLMETLVAIVIISTVVVSVWALSGRIIGAVTKASTKTMDSLKEIEIDAVFRAAVASIRPPFWGPELKPGKDIDIGYVNGVPESRLQALLDGERLTIQSGERSWFFDGILSFEASALPDKTGPIAGIAAKIGLSSGAFEVKALFSSWTLKEPGE